MTRLQLHPEQSGVPQQCPVASAHDKIRTILRGHVGYVLVTCRPTTQSGQMEVEMSYEGDPDLASYLVNGAQGYFEHEQEEDV